MEKIYIGTLSSLHHFRAALANMTKDEYFALFLYPYALGVKDGFCQYLAAIGSGDVADWISTFDMGEVLSLFISTQDSYAGNTLLHNALLDTINKVGAQQKKFVPKKPNFVSLKELLIHIGLKNESDASGFFSKRFSESYITAAIDFYITESKFDPEQKEEILSITADEICIKLKNENYSDLEMNKSAFAIVIETIDKIVPEKIIPNWSGRITNPLTLLAMDTLASNQSDKTENNNDKKKSSNPFFWMIVIFLFIWFLVSIK